MKKTPKIKVGILGATGIVGQRFVQLLQKHPWFEISAVSASSKKIGKQYQNVCNWNLQTEMPISIGRMELAESLPEMDCKIVFSALPEQLARKIEPVFASAGYIVCSNASSYRYQNDVPLLIPEVNPEHLGLIDVQKQNNNCDGFIITNPNCTTTHLVCALHPLHKKFKINKAFVVTMQAISGSGLPGVSSMDILDNIIPSIPGEEEKIEQQEPQKLLGEFSGNYIHPAELTISAHCNRVPVMDGHLISVNVEFDKKSGLDEIIHEWQEYDPLPQKLQLPSAPKPAIIYKTEIDRPQPRLDRMAGSIPGMATVVGRFRTDSILDFKFVILGHNTIRGAAGGSILNAELLVVKGYV